MTAITHLVAGAGAGRITLALTGLDALLERLDTRCIEHEAIETYSNGAQSSRSNCISAARRASI
jgi:hypothetical protein